MNVGGIARCYCEIESKSQWGHIWRHVGGGEFFCLGGGSNTVFSEYFDGTIIKLKGEFTQIKATGTGYICGGGACLAAVCEMARREGLWGLAGLAGIFGTVGGGVFGNCGAFGSEISDVVEWVEVATRSGEMRISKSLCGFAYRKSALPKNSIITRVAIRLEPSSVAEVEKEMRRCRTIRNSTQPIMEKSCGSVYKKLGEVSPARLIEEAGLKGYRVGGLEVSKKHAGFIVNVGGGTPRDFLELARRIEDKIFEKYSVRLEKEIKFIGKPNKIEEIMRF